MIPWQWWPFTSQSSNLSSSIMPIGRWTISLKRQITHQKVTMSLRARQRECDWCVHYTTFSFTVTSLASVISHRCWTFAMWTPWGYFFCLYTPWEVEEITCLYTFARRVVDQVLNDIHGDVHTTNPRFERTIPAQPAGGAFWLLMPRISPFSLLFLSRDFYLEGTTSHCLKLLLHILFNIKKHHT